MRCPKCKTEDMGLTRGRYQYRESGLDYVWLVDWPIYTCTKCNVEMPTLPDTELVAMNVTRALVRQGTPLNGDEIVYLRKAMGLKVIELADALGVSRVTTSRWENNKTSIEPYYDFKLRMEAVDRLLPHERRAMREEVSSLLQRNYRLDREPKRIEPIDVRPQPLAAAEMQPTAAYL
jgi:transcriptional regulator with XRE-family HTH domain